MAIGRDNFWGATLNYTYFHPDLASPWDGEDSITNIKVGSGLEIPDLYDFNDDATDFDSQFDQSLDISRQKIIVKLVSGGGVFTDADFNGFVISDQIDNLNPITSVTFSKLRNIDGLTRSDLYFDANSISVNFRGIEYIPDSVFVLDVTFGTDDPLNTNKLFRKYAPLELAALSAKAAYHLDLIGAPSEKEAGSVNNRDRAADGVFADLADDIDMLDGADLGGLKGLRTSVDFPRAGLEAGVYTNLNAAATVGRTDTALFLAFRGTNDNNGKYGVIQISPETPDGDHWVGKGAHWKLFDPLMDALRPYVNAAANGIQKVYVTGHSLGAAMVEPFMDEFKGAKFEAITFASPGYGTDISDFASDDKRITNLWIKGDPILGKWGWAGGSKTADNEGDRNMIFHDLKDQLDNNDSLHNMAFYVSFAEYLKSSFIDITKDLRGIDYDRYYMNAVPNPKESDIKVGFGAWKEGKEPMVGSVFSEVMLGGAASDKIQAGSGQDYLKGMKGADTLAGQRGEDYLLGGAGNDALVGGRGTDHHWGGGGSDTFRFSDGDFGGDNRKDADRIRDFSKDQNDKIDLSAVDAHTFKPGNQNFKFIGKGSFDAIGQIRYEDTSDGNTMIYGNTDVDKKAEFAILLAGDIDLRASDFDGVFSLILV